MDLRQIGIPFEKKYIQFSPEQINDIASTYHNWQQSEAGYQDVPEYCYSAGIERSGRKTIHWFPASTLSL